MFRQEWPRRRGWLAFYPAGLRTRGTEQPVRPRGQRAEKMKVYHRVGGGTEIGGCDGKQGVNGAECAGA